MQKLSTHLKQIIQLQRNYRAALPGRDMILARIFNSEYDEIIKREKQLSPREAENLRTLSFAVHEKAQTEKLDLQLIVSLHEIITTKTGDETYGRFRKHKERARIKTEIEDYVAPKPAQMHKILDEILVTYYSSHQQGIVKRLAQLHLNFCHARPFVDANGRVARALVNHLLIREGFPPIIFPIYHKIDRKKYNESFQEFNKKKLTKKMEEIIAEALIDSLNKRLAYLDYKKIIPLSTYAKSKKIPIPNLLNKAKRRSIPAFVEDGEWRIGV